MFRRTKEDFICGQCGAEMQGTGYTNHCSRCLWSKHVDIDPGDRLAKCGGMMKPVWLEIEKNEHVITHACTRCSHKRRQRVSASDSNEAILALARACVHKQDM